MSTWAIPVGEPSSKESFEDQYYHVKSERDELTQKLNDLDDANRMLRTRCARLETIQKKAVNGAVAGQVASSMMDPLGKRDVHGIQHDYQELFSCYSALQRDYRAAVTKQNKRRKYKLSSCDMHIGSTPKMVAQITLPKGNLVAVVRCWMWIYKFPSLWPTKKISKMH